MPFPLVARGLSALNTARKSEVPMLSGFGKLLAGCLLGLAMVGGAAACEYKVVPYGSALAGSEAKIVVTGVMHKRISSIWCEKLPPSEYELTLIANSYANEGQGEFYAHVIIGMRKRDSGLMPRKTFASHVHIKRDGNRPDAVARAAQYVTEEFLGSLDRLIDEFGSLDRLTAE